MARVKRCPACPRENPPTSPFCACGASLATVPLTEATVTARVEEANPVPTSGAALICPDPSCRHPNLAGSERCLRCNVALTERPAATPEPPDPTRRDPAPTGRDASPAPTRRDERPDDRAQPTLLRLPDALARRYRVVRQLLSQGAEADLLLIEPLTGDAQVVCKLYRPGLRPNTEVLSRIGASHPEHVVRILEHGETEGVSYEIMEWAERGSLRALFDQGACTPARAGQLLSELHAALSALHAQHILHRDLKPENLLVRSVEPLRIALTDFGIASVSETTLHFTTVHRTVRYAAPEAAAGVVSPASDYWSVGMILAEALTGRHPFAGLSERVIALRLSTHPVPLEGIDEPWLALCRGLLVRDPAQRWGKAEIERWLAQDRTLAVPVETDAPSVAGESRAGRPYRIQTKECWTGKDLAAQLAHHWTDGIKGLQRNLIAPWLRDELHDQDSVLLVMDLLEDASLTPDQRLLRLILHLAPEQSPVWKGMSVALCDLTALARRALQGEAECRDTLAEIWDLGVVPTLAQAGHPAHGELQNRWSEAVTSYRQGWEKAIAGGAPATAEPDLRTALAALLLAVSDADFAQTLRTQAESAKNDDATACSWYAALAEVDFGVTTDALIAAYLLPLATQTGKEERERADEEATQQAAEKAKTDAKERQQKRRTKALILAVLVVTLSVILAYYLHQQREEAQATQVLREQSDNMVFVKGGTFTMGSPPTEKGRHINEQQKSVTVNDFSIGKYEVTQGEWRAVKGEEYPQGGLADCTRRCCGDRCPVDQAQWTHVQDYIKKLNVLTGKHYRLPTEAEWEYACRSGGKPELYCGGSDLDQLAWYRGNSGNPLSFPVGQKAPNGLGLYDMSGNVPEWTCSEFTPHYDGSENRCARDDQDKVKTDVKWNGNTPNMKTRGVLAVRSAAVYSDRATMRSASRDGLGSDAGKGSVGFRLAHD